MSSNSKRGAEAKPAPQSDVVLVTGVSGGGKSIAMHALEDAGFFCVDNLPPELLLEFLTLEKQRGKRRVAIAVDVRSAGSLPHLLPLIKQLRTEGVGLRSIFLDANTDTLMRRFSETRRPHPLRQAQQDGGDGLALDSGADALKYRVPFHPAQDGNSVELGVEQAAFAQNASDFQTSLTFLNLQLKGLAKAIAGQ